MAPSKNSRSKAQIERNMEVMRVPSSSPEIVAQPVQALKPQGQSKKRPASSDGSNIEIAETPVVLKKAKKSIRPMPASPEFLKSPPVTVTQRNTRKAASIAKKLSFGSIESDKNISAASHTAQLSSPISFHKTKRISKPSEKAKYMQFNKELTPDNAVVSDSNATPPEKIFNNSTASEKKSKDNTPPDITVTKKLVKVEDMELISGNDSDLQREWASDNDKGKKAEDIKSSSLTAKNEPCTLIPFMTVIKEAQFRGEITDKESSLPLYDSVIRYLTPIGHKNFQRAFSFKSNGIVVNPAQDNASTACVSRESRVVFSGSRSSILFLSSGCVATCNLFIPGVNGYGANQHNVKKIGVWLLHEEFDAMTAYFGAVYGVSVFYCHYICDILTFHSQKEGGGSITSNNTVASSSSSPTKPSSLFKSRLPPRRSTAATLSFPPFVKFNEQVPIYDIRKQDFKFTASEFASLGSLPLYQNGISDVPQNAAVTVGYTVNTFPYTQGDAPPNSLSLSLNIQFVLLHGKINAP